MSITRNDDPWLVEHYKDMIRKVPAPGTGLESAGMTSTEPDLSDSGIGERTNFVEAELRRIIKQHLGDEPKLYQIARQIVAGGNTALRMLRDDDEEALEEDAGVRADLEAIIRTDGSRPSFMVRNGEIDRTTSPLGAWADTLDASADGINDGLQCVGRIDNPESQQGFEGTGFLVAENLIVTNRHVLQAIASRDARGVWQFKSGAAIDFGHEFRGRPSVTPRTLRQVVFCGSKAIQLNNPVDHTKLDLALVEIEPVAPKDLPRTILALDIAPDWAQPDLVTFTIGYPGTPPFGQNTPTLLERLFQSTFGCKRLAPGLVMKPQANVHTWTLAHDATTLGGNSGSVVLVAGRETIAAGLHYGGRRIEPAENWGHVLGRVLDETDGTSEKTLREHLTSHGVTLVDRRGAEG